MPPQVRMVYGSLWSGRATLDGGLTLSWVGSWQNLLLGRFVSDLRLSGANTLLNATLYATPFRIGVENLKGRGGPDMLSLVPGTLPCDGQAVVDIDAISVSRSAVTALGRVAISESTCKLPGATPFSAPALDLRLTGDGADGLATLTTDDAATTRFGHGRVSPDGWIKLQIEPAAAILFPGLPTSAPTLLELQLF